MNPCGQHGQKKDRFHLAVDRPADLPFIHAHLLHDDKAVVILIALRNLFIVDDKHRRHEKQKAQENAHKEDAAVKGIEIFSCILRLNSAFFSEIQST